MARSGDRHSISGTAVELPLRLIPDEPTPLYLQIVHQLKQLIITQRLDDGARLPAVRALAAELEVNPGTVVQAYRELADDGLIESVRGRGTVVRHLSATTADELVRAALLEREAERLATRARALGFGPDEARQQLGAAFLGAPVPVPVLFVGLTAAQAVRYVDEQLGPRYHGHGVRFVPFGLDDVVKASPALRHELQLAYTVVTFVTTAPEVERSLAAHGLPAEIVGVTAELSPDTTARLRSLDSSRRYTLVTEHRAVTTALAIVELESGVPHEALDVIATRPDGTLDAGALDDLAAGDRAVIYTFGVADAIAALRLHAERLLELRFRLTPSAFDRLDARWIAR